MRCMGVILAGGKSRRFGAEKALAMLAGRPVIAHVRAALAVESVAVAGSEAAAAAIGAERLADPPGAPEGPLAGVLAGLSWARELGAEAVVTAPCDAPLLPADLAVRLMTAIGPAPAAYAETDNGAEPLCALWRVEAAHALAETLAAGHPSVIGYLRRIGARAAPFADASAFLNVNTPEDFERAQAILRTRGEH